MRTVDFFFRIHGFAHPNHESDAKSWSIFTINRGGSTFGDETVVDLYFSKSHKPPVHQNAVALLPFQSQISQYLDTRDTAIMLGFESFVPLLMKGNEYASPMAALNYR